MGPIAAAVFVSLALGQAGPDGAQLQRGRALAQAECGTCHAVGPTGASPLLYAPPFRDLHRRYPVEDLAEALAEGILTGHPAMPQFRFEPQEIEALIGYLKSLEPRKTGSAGAAAPVP